MATLAQDKNGNYRARKRLPDDVREAYGRLYGPRYEAKFFAPSSTRRQEAERLFDEWKAETSARVANIRAEQRGEGASLTDKQARALAGEWYDWFVGRHPMRDQEYWEGVRDRVGEALKEASGDEAWEADPRRRDDLWRTDEDLKKAVRPVLADIGETAQFLHTKGIVLNHAAQVRFLDNLHDDLAAALKRLIRQSRGDYSPDKYPERFPKFEGADTGETPWQLFESWASERQPAISTIESWRPVFRAMEGHFKERSAASISPDEAQQWITSLVTTSRSARTVRDTWIAASKTVFGWAAKHKHIPRNSFLGVAVTVRKRVRNRETQAFRPQEWRTILKASLAITDTSKPSEAAKRWVPWICAYTGARPAEITQLRKQDVFEQDGVFGLRLTPEAGSIKTNVARSVPLHEHLLAQGFLKFVQEHSDGPLFYKPAKTTNSAGALKVKKPRASQVRQRLATWVRSLGINDPELRPNHAWRHTFKQIADRNKISERMSDYITGHAHRSIGASYGAPTLEDMADALREFPRYKLGGN